MYAHEVRPTQVVRIVDDADNVELRGRKFMVLERHPFDGYWLQCMETGHVNTKWFAEPADMTIEEPAFRSDHLVITLNNGQKALVMTERGDWGLIVGSRSHTWQIVHLPSNMTFGAELPKRALALKVIEHFRRVGDFPSLEAVRPAVPELAEIFARVTK